jgi:hypothetical protein
MLVRSATNHIVYGSLINAEFPGNDGLFLAVGNPFTYFAYLLFRKLVAWLSEFLRHVIHIRGMCAEKQMGGVATMTVIALVTNLKAIRDRAKVKFIANSGGNPRSIGVMQVSPRFDGSTLPQPTLIRAALDDTGPKAYFERAFLDRGQWSKHGMVSVNKPFRMTRKPSHLSASFNRDTGIFAASALTLAVGLQQSVLGDPGGVILEIVREMGRGCRIAHVVSSFIAIGQSQGRLQPSPGTSYWCATGVFYHRCIINTTVMEGFCIFLPVARHGYHGLLLELKITPNKPSAAQLEWIRRLTAEGYLCQVLWDDPAAVMALLEWYLEGKEP